MQKAETRPAGRSATPFKSALSNRTILCLAFLFCVTPLSASTLYVDIDNTTGPWNGSLEFPYRYIQQAVNAATPGSQIRIASGTYYENLVINNKDLTLSARPRQAVIVDGQQLESVVAIVNSTVQMERLTVTNGLAENGGGMYIDRSTVVLSRVTVTANSARDGQIGAGPDGAGTNGGHGGGIFATGYELEMTNCTISINSAGDGGNGADGLLHSTDGGHGGSGGGVYTLDCKLKLADCTITANSTGDGGDGGIGIDWDSHYGGSSGYGAGLFIHQFTIYDPIELHGCYIADNVIGHGGEADPWEGFGSGGDTGHGSGAYIDSCAKIDIDSCQFVNNTIGVGGYAAFGGDGGDGGGACLSSEYLVEISQCEFVNNLSGSGANGWDLGGYGGHGGGAWIGSPTTTLTDCKIVGNGSGDSAHYATAGSGGGLLYR